MYWADEIAEQLIAKNPEKESFTCASGISPSGFVHIGNLREVATSFFVSKALQDRGKKVRFIFSWDNYDRLRKVPQNVPATFSQYIGMPLKKIPDPYNCHNSYAEHFQQPFMDSLASMGIEIEHLSQADRYQTGMYREGIILAVQKRKEIYDILMSFKTQDVNNDDRDNYYPLNIYCEECGRDTTTITGETENGTVLDYQCKCGHHGKLDLHTQNNCKLVWKVDWPMRWVHEGVDFEPGGRDHSSEGGSFQVASVIVDKIFGGKAPLYRGYDFVGIKGSNAKVSSSKGDCITPETLLNVYPPEIVLWLYTRFLPEKAFDIALDGDVLRNYTEFDRMLEQYQSGNADEVVKRIMDMSLYGRTEELHTQVSAQHIASFAPIVNFDIDVLVALLNKIGENYTKEQIQDRFNKIKFWLENFCPENIEKLLPNRNDEFYATMLDEEKGWIKHLVMELNNKEFSIEEMQALLYEIPKINGEQDKVRQKRFFEVVYNLLIGKNKGPRLYLFLYAIEKATLLPLLTFE